MASSVEIANRALTKLGAARIVAFSDNNKQAKFMSANYDIIRQAELRAHVWSFAKKRTTLPASATAPSWQFAKAYELPEDCLRVTQVNDISTVYGLQDAFTSDDRPFMITGRTIETDYGAPLRVIYIRDLSDTAIYDALFVEAFAAKLAMEGCEEITGSTTKWQKANQDYKMAINQAVLVNSIELPPAPLQETSWTMAGRT